MNAKVIDALKKVIVDNESQKIELMEIEDAQERIDKLYEYCTEWSDGEFSKEEFENTLYECIIFTFENWGTMEGLENMDLENVAGGKNQFLRKLTASSLAFAALLGAIPNMNISPKVSATNFLSRLHIVKNVKEEYAALETPDKVVATVVAAFLAAGLYKLGKWLFTPIYNNFVTPTVNFLKEKLIYNRRKLSGNPVEFSRAAHKFLTQNVFAQDKAINAIVNIISGHIDIWSEGNKGKADARKSACVMTFLGDSGTGKTYCARLLSQLLFGRDMQPWQFITTSSVKTPPPPSNAPVINVNLSPFARRQQNNNKPTDAEALADASPADRLFNENTELVRQLRKNNNVIIVIDEIDKIHKNDPQDTILERLRDAKDTGTLRIRLANGKYEDIDVSKTVFICISNEFRECWGLPKVDLTPAQAAARTTVVRDRSLVNRFDIVEFENFKVKDYMVILAPLVKELQQAYLKAHKINLQFSEGFAKNVAMVAEDKNKGVRGINDFLVKLRGALVNVRSKIGALPKEGESSLKVLVDYDKESDQFTTKIEK